MTGNEKSKLDKNNAVNHPNHYNNGDIEVIDYIKSYKYEEVISKFAK